MNIENYYKIDGTKLSFDREQASVFAKTIAGDFNQLQHIYFHFFQHFPGSM